MGATAHGRTTAAGRLPAPELVAPRAPSVAPTDAHAPGVTLLVPMSVLHTAYLDEILTGLRSHGHAVHHVLLDASADVLHARIAADTVERSAATWRTAHIATYETIRSDLGARGVAIDTCSAAPRDVATAIIERVVGPMTNS